MTWRRCSVVLGGVAAAMLGLAPAAWADPAGPTDYESAVVAIDPAADGFEVEIIGGDAFVLLRASSREVIEVVGYRGEPYLRFLPGGVVLENQNSPTTYLNIDRYADTEVPPGVDPAAEPRWREVATDGSYAWHDHRAHWMNDARPPGRRPGDVILEGVVPLLVGGGEVDLEVISVWQPAPSPLPGAAGAVLGLAVIGGLWRFGTSRRSALALAVVAAAAAALGTIAYLSVPAETGPSWTLWAAPLAAVALAVVVLVVRLRAPASLLLAGSALVVVWGITRWEWLWRALLPTSAPFWLDRLVTGAALAVGLGIAVLAMRTTLQGASAPRAPRR